MPSKTSNKTIEINHCVKEVSKQLLKNHPSIQDVVLVGILDLGLPIANRIASYIHAQTGELPRVGQLDISLFRNDFREEGQQFINIQKSMIPCNLSDKTVILIDALFYEGHHARAALNALCDFEPPQKIELAVLVQKQGKKLPLSPDYIGHTLPSNEANTFQIRLLEIDGEDKLINL